MTRKDRLILDELVYEKVRVAARLRSMRRFERDLERSIHSALLRSECAEQTDQVLGDSVRRAIRRLANLDRRATQSQCFDSKEGTS